MTQKLILGAVCWCCMCGILATYSMRYQEADRHIAIERCLDDSSDDVEGLTTDRDKLRCVLKVVM
jgi:L-cysteine desulfidase